MGESQDAGQISPAGLPAKKGRNCRKDGIAQIPLLLIGHFPLLKSSLITLHIYQTLQHVGSSSQPPIPCRYDLRLTHASKHTYLLYAWTLESTDVTLQSTLAHCSVRMSSSRSGMPLRTAQRSQKNWPRFRNRPSATSSNSSRTAVSTA